MTVGRQRLSATAALRVAAAWVVVVVAAAALPGSGAEAGGSSASPEGTERVTVAGERFDLEPAMTPEARYEGLSGRASIPERGGMLFVFPDARPRSFVMRRCLVPIDLIYLDAGGRVITTHAMTVEPPGTPDRELTPYHSRYPAQFAIELRGGWLERLDLEPGEKVSLNADRLKATAR